MRGGFETKLGQTPLKGIPPEGKKKDLQRSSDSGQCSKKIPLPLPGSSYHFEPVFLENWGNYGEDPGEDVGMIVAVETKWGKTQGDEFLNLSPAFLFQILGVNKALPHSIKENWRRKKFSIFPHQRRDPGEGGSFGNIEMKPHGNSFFNRNHCPGSSAFSHVNNQ